jgi:hypothetical protein
MAKLLQLNDAFLKNIKHSWFSKSHDFITTHEFIPLAETWFKSTRHNNLHGWNDFPCVDVILGCTHFIESLVLKYGWDGFQILPEEYAYYGLMGKYGSELGNLEPLKPLLISLPNWRYADLRPEWPDLLNECELKNIDIHIDFAWITVARGIDIDLSHPCIKSFAMSLSKYHMEWNRIGLRWSRQRTMDSVTIFNRFHREVNSSLTSCGAYIMNNLPRDYGWDVYGKAHHETCEKLNLLPTKLIHVATKPDLSDVVGIGEILSNLTPDSI